MCGQSGCHRGHGGGCGGHSHHHEGGGHGREEACACGCGHERGHEDGGYRCGGGRGAHHGHRGRCCCCEGRPLGFRRHFVSRAERIAALEAYLAELRVEVAAVEEHLADLKKTA